MPDLDNRALAAWMVSRLSGAGLLGAAGLARAVTRAAAAVPANFMCEADHRG